MTWLTPKEDIKLRCTVTLVVRKSMLATLRLLMISFISREI